MRDDEVAKRYRDYGKARRQEREDAAWRMIGNLALTAGFIGIPVALAPVTATAVAGYLLAWRSGWAPRRLYVLAVAQLPLVALWLAAVAGWPCPLPGHGPGPWWVRLLAATYRSWLLMWRLALDGDPRALLAIPPAAIPLGLAAGGYAWGWRRFRMTAGTGGRHPAAPAAFDRRMWRRQSRAARAIARSRSTPVVIHNETILIGPAIRATGHRQAPDLTLPYERLRSHQVVVGSTGTGKTTLLLRLWAGFMAVGMARHARGRRQGDGPGRPLLVVIDCKGGASSQEVAARARDVLLAAGAGSVASWPRQPLSLWALPPDRLVTTLLDLIEHGAGGAAYFRDVMGAIVRLAVEAPPGPPRSAAEFLTRLSAGWLETTYQGTGQVEPVRGEIRAHSGSVAMRFRELWRKLGPGLDGPPDVTFADADAWYCVLEGTAEVSVAEAQARMLVDLLAHFTVTGSREIVLCIDEFSAVSRRVPVWELYERARSLGLAVQVSAQSWEGLGASDDERRRIASTAEGGIWLLRTPRPEPIAELAGMADGVSTTRRQSGKDHWADSGTTAARQQPVVDPQLIRSLATGQAAYIHRGGVTYVHVTPPPRQRRGSGPRMAQRPGLGPAPGLPLEPQPAQPQQERPRGEAAPQFHENQWPLLPWEPQARQSPQGTRERRAPSPGEVLGAMFKEHRLPPDPG
jgi:hypothetical protein